LTYETQDLAEHFSGRLAPGRLARPHRWQYDSCVHQHRKQARFVDPVEGHTWTSLRHSWNAHYGTHKGPSGRTWHYSSDSNFNRDAKAALLRLLFPGWTPT
jgi:hypothetical protein